MLHEVSWRFIPIESVVFWWSIWWDDSWGEASSRYKISKRSLIYLDMIPTYNLIECVHSERMAMMKVTSKNRTVYYQYDWPGFVRSSESITYGFGRFWGTICGGTWPSKFSSLPSHRVANPRRSSNAAARRDESATKICCRNSAEGKDPLALGRWCPPPVVSWFLVIKL